jgi:putative hemolysin
MNRKIIVGAIALGALILVGISLFIFDLKSSRNQVANPASEYCISQGHELEIREEEEGQRGYCVSSSGEECEEWAFYRGDCSLGETEKCVPASCCHASSCVLESSAPNCSGVFCTMECRAGTMDCGAGHCGFVDGKCEVIWNEE